jgi:outer membrane murein-binding lipoprotein Lpp
MRPTTLSAVTAVSLVALVLTTVGLVVQTRRVSQAEARADELAAEVDDLRAEVRQLERDLAAGGGSDGPLGGLLDGLLGRDGDGLEDLFGGLLGGDSEGLGGLLDGLLSGANGTAGAECLSPEGGGLGELFGGLLRGGGGLPDDPDELVDVIADQVADLRELSWQEEVSVDFLDDTQLRGRLDELLSEDEDPTADDAERRLLETLGAIPPGTDLTQLRRDLLDEQVAGFYSPETGELVVRVPDDGEVRPVDRITIAHELQHALVDQTLGLPDLDAFEDDGDAALAALAVVEGDATLLMNLWALEHVAVTDQLGALFGGDLAAAQASLETVPPFLQRELLYPYTDGLERICDRYLVDGWASVDAAYDDLPTTTAEVLFGPRANPAGEVATVSAPAGYEQVLTTTFGAAPLTWLLEAPGGDEARALDRPRERARVWAGGQAHVWADGDATAVGLALVDGGEGPPLCGTVNDWYAASFPDARREQAEGATVFRGSAATAVLRCDGDDVVLASAPDLTTATRIVAG